MYINENRSPLIVSGLFTEKEKTGYRTHMEQVSNIDIEAVRQVLSSFDTEIPSSEGTLNRARRYNGDPVYSVALDHFTAFRRARSGEFGLEKDVEPLSSVGQIIAAI